MLVIDPFSIPEVVQNFTTNQSLHQNFNMGYPVILNLNSSSWGKKMPVPGQWAESDPKLAWAW